MHIFNLNTGEFCEFPAADTDLDDSRGNYFPIQDKAISKLNS